MSGYKITSSEVKEALRKLKNKKAPGMDNLKPELYKALVESSICVEKLTECLNRILENGEISENWKTSTTKMIKKTNRPTVKDLRPIALTNSSYKIFMAIMKEKIEKHLEIHNEMMETQAGFTQRRRIEDNLLILQYCIENSFINCKPLIVASIDYSKAFDSIKREKRVETLKEYKIHPKVIDVITKIYEDDKTYVKLPDVETEIKVTSGIR